MISVVCMMRSLEAACILAYIETATVKLLACSSSQQFVLLRRPSCCMVSAAAAASTRSGVTGQGSVQQILRLRLQHWVLVMLVAQSTAMLTNAWPICSAGQWKLSARVRMSTWIGCVAAAYACAEDGSSV
jgi:hypothetical protein